MGGRIGDTVRRWGAAARRTVSRALARFGMDPALDTAEERGTTPVATGPAPGHPEAVPECRELTRDERLWQIELLGPGEESEAE